MRDRKEMWCRIGSCWLGPSAFPQKTESQQHILVVAESSKRSSDQTILFDLLLKLGDNLRHYGKLGLA
jgi:hypothetical protein